MRKAVYVLLMSVIFLAGCATADDDTPEPQVAPPTEVQDETSPVTDDTPEPTATFIPPPSSFDEDEFEEQLSNDNEPTPPPAPTYRDSQGTLIPIEVVTELAAQREAIPTLGAQDVVAPPVGQIGRVSTVEAPPPDINEPPLSGFDYIYFEQIGGPNDITLRFEVYDDGRINFFEEEIPDLTASQAELDRVAQLIDEIGFFEIQATFVGAAPGSENTYRYRMAVVNGSTQRAIQAQDGFMPPEIIELFGAVRGLIEETPGFLLTPEFTPEATP